MKKALIMALALLVGVSMSAQAADQLVQFKAGDIAMTVLDSDGVSPLADASIKMLSPEDNSVLSETVSDDFGKAVLALEEGRYLLNISDVTLAVMDVSADASITSCRVVVPAASMLVVGQEAGGDNSSDSNLREWVAAAGIIAGLAILAGGGAAIIAHQQPSKTIGRSEPAPAPAEQPRKHKSTPTPGPTPPGPSVL